jgi:hypothetical protein
VKNARGQQPDFDAMESLGERRGGKVGAAWQKTSTEIISAELTKQVPKFILVLHKPAPSKTAANQRPK